MGSAILPARLKNFNEDKFRFEFKTFGARNPSSEVTGACGRHQGIGAGQKHRNRRRGRAGSRPCTWGDKEGEKDVLWMQVGIDCEVTELPI